MVAPLLRREDVDLHDLEGLAFGLAVEAVDLVARREAQVGDLGLEPLGVVLDDQAGLDAGIHEVDGVEGGPRGRVVHHADVVDRREVDVGALAVAAPHEPRRAAAVGDAEGEVQHRPQVVVVEPRGHQAVGALRRLGPLEPRVHHLPLDGRDLLCEEEPVLDAEVEGLRCPLHREHRGVDLGGDVGGEEGAVGGVAPAVVALAVPAVAARHEARRARALIGRSRARVLADELLGELGVLAPEAPHDPVVAAALAGQVGVPVAALELGGVLLASEAVLEGGRDHLARGLQGEHGGRDLLDPLDAEGAVPRPSLPVGGEHLAEGDTPAGSSACFT